MIKKFIAVALLGLAASVGFTSSAQAEEVVVVHHTHRVYHHVYHHRHHHVTVIRS